MTTSWSSLKPDRVLGIDPGLVATGVGIVTFDEHERPRALYSGTIRPPRGETIAKRLYHLQIRIGEVISEFQPDCVAVEEAFYHKNVKSALILGQARGAALAAAAAADLDVMELSPKTVKQAAVGTGGAAKEQVAAMVVALLQLDNPPDSADACDALAVALAALHRRAIPAQIRS